MKIEEYKLGQKVSLYGRIDAIDIANIHDKENTTILSIKTVTGKISVNPKWEKVRLDQPKPVVPQFVAEWYEENKDKLEEELCYQIWLIRESGAETDFEYWLTETENPIQTLINMHQFGYTVQKEKLYTVEIPSNDDMPMKLMLVKRENKVRIEFFNKEDNGVYLQLTEAEIRKDYDWAWEQGFAKEVTE